MKIQTTLVRENPVPYIPRILYPRESKTHSLLEDGFFKNVIANDEKAMTNFLSQWRYCEINSLEILPQEQKLDHALQKAIRYDVRGIINGKILFVIEVQRQGTCAKVLKRMEYYAARLLAAQKMRGKEYEELKSVWLILIADFNFFPNPGIITDETETRLRIAQIPLTTVIHLSIMETGRTEFLRKKPVQELMGLERWAILFGNSGDPEKQEWIRSICEQDEEIRKVVEKMSEWPKNYEEYMQQTMEIMREMDLEDLREIDFHRGALYKVVNQVLKNAKKGRASKEIAEILDEEESIVQQILSCHNEHPELSAEQIIKRIESYA